MAGQKCPNSDKESTRVHRQREIGRVFLQIVISSSTTAIVIVRLGFFFARCRTVSVQYFLWRHHDHQTAAERCGGEEIDQ